MLITPGIVENETTETNYAPGIAPESGTGLDIPVRTDNGAQPAESVPQEAPRVIPDLMDKSVLVTLDLKRIGNSKKVATDYVQADTDKNMVAVSKRLFKCEELDRIRTLDGTIRGFLTSVTLPSVVKVNFYLLPIASIERVDDQLKRFRYERAGLVQKFIESYSNILQGSEIRLGELYNRRDYPDVEQLRDMFTMSWRYTTFGVPDALQQISPQIFEHERDKAKKQWQEAAVEVQQILRAQFLELVARMKDRLTPGEDGKKKIFRNSLVTNMREFLDEFDNLNLTDDRELSSLVEQARGLVEGLDPEDLRQSDTLRDKISEGFSAITDNLENLITDAPMRQFSFDEEN